MIRRVLLKGCQSLLGGVAASGEDILTRRRIAGLRSHVRWHRHFQELKRVRRSDFVVRRPAWDEQRISLFDPHYIIASELQIDPAAQHVDELTLADMNVPAGRIRQSLRRRRNLSANSPAAGRGDAGAHDISSIRDVLGRSLPRPSL